MESPAACYIGARRNAEDGKYYWRITQWIMPSLHADPAARRPSDRRPLLGADRRRELLGVELSTTMPTRALTQRGARGDATPARASMRRSMPGTFRPVANKDNDYLMDRAAQKAGRTSQRRRRLRHAGRVAAGKHGADPGPHAARTWCSTDSGIIMARRRLIAAAQELARRRAAAGRRSRAPARALGS